MPMHYFRQLSRHHSTETAVLKVVSDIRMAIDRGNVAILLLLDMSAAFDTVGHNILIERLDRTFAIRQMALDWLRSYLKNRNQLIVTASADPVTQNVSSGVPQGSVLGPILFSLYVAEIEQLVARHGFHSHQYADDTQIYAFCEPHNMPHLALRMAECFSDVASWTSSNSLRLNGDKTEATWFHPARRSMPTPPVQLSGVTITPSVVVRNLGVYFDTSLSMENHAGRIAAACFSTLRVLREARHSVPREVLTALVIQLVLTKLDYCNSILYGSNKWALHKLQVVMNTAARLIFNARLTDHVSPLLDDLHWLPIAKRIPYKIALMVYKAHTHWSPQYLQELLTTTASQRGRVSLRSSDTINFIIPRTRRVHYGDRSFHACGPRTWNDLPSHVRSSETLTSFKNNLKTHLFDLPSY